MREVYPVPDAIFEQHSAWLATSGAGKTIAVKGGVERILARGERVVVIDPTGVWWGLRFGRDGRRASGLEPVVLGRHHADLPLEEGSGEAVAHALGGSSTSAILNLKGMSVAARSRFITAFFETLVDANKGVLHLVIDEVHLFAPQSGGSGLTPAMLHATNNMVSLGRSAGLRIVMISQRPAKVHKDSLTQAKALVALQLSHPLDQRPVRDWLSTTVSDKLQEAEILRSLAGLPVGEGWLSAPQIGLLGRVRFPMIATYDSSRAGAEEIPLKPLDVGALRKAMATNSPSVDKSVDTKTPKANGKAGLVDERPPSAAELAAAEQRGYERGLGDGAVKAARQGWTSALNEARDAIAAVTEKMGAIDQESPIASPKAVLCACSASGEPSELLVTEAERAAALSVWTDIWQKGETSRRDVIYLSLEAAAKARQAAPPRLRASAPEPADASGMTPLDHEAVLHAAAKIAETAHADPMWDHDHQVAERYGSHVAGLIRALPALANRGGEGWQPIATAAAPSEVTREGEDVMLR